MVTEELVLLMTEAEAASQDRLAAAAAEAAAAAAGAAATAATAAAAAASTATAGPAASTAAAGGETAGEGGGARKKQRTSGFMRRCTTSIAPSQQVPEQHQLISANGRFTAVALQEIGNFKKQADLPMYTDEDCRIPSNPLLWWKEHQAEFPQLSKLARRVLCIPATSAPSERIFSVAGLTVTKQRNRLTAENVALLVYLHNAWQPAEAWRKAHPLEA